MPSDRMNIDAPVDLGAYWKGQDPPGPYQILPSRGQMLARILLILVSTVLALIGILLGIGGLAMLDQ